MPHYYDLTLQPIFKPEMKPEVFNGTVKIDFTCEKDTTRLVMHMIDLLLDNSTIQVTSQTDKEFKASQKNLQWSYDPVTHFITFEFDTKFKKGLNYTFSVSYQGFFKDDLTGFYRTYYQDDNGNKRFV